ncbi:hypothetical protein V2W30_22595 [Streptomyces sp. Q6]|uniref:Uncharacterized protein n=1 Tax=Streptomyces citrinus TaxID=3118173 RepID=A0ACD5AFF6_9ACTN
MAYVEITVHGPITYGADYVVVQCPACAATHSHRVSGDLGDDSVPVSLACVNGHAVPIPSDLDAREVLFIVAMRAE